MCVVSALGMGRRPAPEWAVALLMVALGLYFANFTYVHYAQNNWLQAIAGVGLTGAALWHAAVVWASPPTPKSRIVEIRVAHHRHAARDPAVA
jgi:hypothetical protein